MSDYLLISLCINNPNNGQSTGQLWAIQFGDYIKLESNFIPDPNVVCHRINNDHIRIGRRSFSIIEYYSWYGNWCWDAVRVTLQVATDVLAYIQSMRLHGLQKFGVEEAYEPFFRAYEKGEKIDLANIKGLPL